MAGEVDKHQNPTFKFDVPSIGVGRMVTTTTYIAIILGLLESDKYSQVSVINSVMEHIGITPDDVVIDREYSEGRRKDLNYKRRKYSWEADE